MVTGLRGEKKEGSPGGGKNKNKIKRRIPKGQGNKERTRNEKNRPIIERL